MGKTEKQSFISLKVLSDFDNYLRESMKWLMHLAMAWLNYQNCATVMQNTENKFYKLQNLMIQCLIDKQIDNQTIIVDTNGKNCNYRTIFCK